MSGDSLQELTRELAVLVGRERTRRFIQRTVDTAGVDLTPGDAWLLVQGEEGLALDDPEAIAAERPVDGVVIRDLLASLAARGLIVDGELTEVGHTTAGRLLDAYRECLHSLIEDWHPDDDPRVSDALSRLADELADEPPAVRV